LAVNQRCVVANDRTPATLPSGVDRGCDMHISMRVHSTLTGRVLSTVHH
jgi:hypothetical protein